VDAFRGQVPKQAPDPNDTLGVKTVDRFIEDEMVRVTKQCCRDAQTLFHAQGERADPPAGGIDQAGLLENFVDPRPGDPGGCRDRSEIVPGAQPRDSALAIEQHADGPDRVGEVPRAAASHRARADVRPFQPSHHAHRRGLSRPVGAEEAGDTTVGCGEAVPSTARTWPYVLVIPSTSIILSTPGTLSSWALPLHGLGGHVS